jgi:cyclopropane fatty-acyl-phospholipid synthase-like methyltransferase
MADTPRIWTIREGRHRIHNPFSPEKYATLGRALHLEPGMTALDLASGSGEMLCTWAHEHGLTGTGVDISEAFVDAARARAAELGVTSLVRFVEADARGYVAGPVDLASCVGATWIGDGVPGTIDLLSRSLRPGGVMLIGEPYWRRTPPDQQTAEATGATSVTDFLSLPGLLSQFDELGHDVVEMVLSSQDDWDRYMAPQWMTMRRWLDENPGDELADEVRELLRTEPAQYAQYTREYLGWGVFALRRR